MDKIYVVEYLDEFWNLSNPVHFFSTREKADLFLGKIKEKFPKNSYFISEFNLDDMTIPEDD